MNYSSNIILRAGYNRIQTVYASQVYGTFFGVFASFDVKNLANDQGTNKKQRGIQSIDFHLLNYKGPKNIKIVNDFVKPKAFDTEIGCGWELELPVKHASDASPYQKKMTLDMVKLMGDKDGLVLKDGDYFNIQRTLRRMNENITPQTKLVDKAFVDGVFDDEFYLRDGLYITDKNHVAYKRANMMKSPYTQTGWTSCTPSNNFVIA